MKTMYVKFKYLVDVFDAMDSIKEAKEDQIDLNVYYDSNPFLIAKFFESLKYSEYELEGVATKSYDCFLISIKRK